MKDDRLGKRKSRNQGGNLREYEMGYYLIITDTDQTERCYFQGIKELLPISLKNKIEIQIVKTKTRSLVECAKEYMAYSAQLKEVWIVFDRDKVPNFDTIINEAKDNGINVGWSNPCFEIWLFAYFGKMSTGMDSVQCCHKFSEEFKRRIRQEYSKNDSNMYKKLVKFGDEISAIKKANQTLEKYKRDSVELPSEMNPGTTIYLLVEKIQEKIEHCAE